MRDVRLDASHLLEAVRQKILTIDQMERVLAVARSGPVAPAPAGVGPASTILAIVAGLAVVASGVSMLRGVNDEGISPSAVAASSVGAIACLAVGALLCHFRWGRLAGSILRAGAAVWSWGVVVGLITRVAPIYRPSYGSTYAEPGGPSWPLEFQAYTHQLHWTFAGASLASLVFAVVLWRFQRCRPALVVAALHPIALALLCLVELPSAH